jgi:MoaA/NifB/PqqE/SkfB family radical SAM enzyme
VDRHVTDRSAALGVLWRGPLDSCNYGCAYCPFAKRAPSRSVLRADRDALTRFVAWVANARAWQLQLLFTPYGEALIWPWYRRAMVALSQLPHVHQVTIQTNGSGPMDFVEQAERSRLSLWITYHPSEVELGAFVARVSGLHARGVRLSVGMVTTPQRIDEAERLREALPAEIPLWLNAQKPGPRFDDAALARARRLDAMFDLESTRHRSRGRACKTGEDVISVDGSGAIRRCNFVDELLGNLYRDDLEALLRPRVCTRATCQCWIGYAHLTQLRVREAHDPHAWFARMTGPAHTTGSA